MTTRKSKPLSFDALVRALCDHGCRARTEDADLILFNASGLPEEVVEAVRVHRDALRDAVARIQAENEPERKSSRFSFASAVTGPGLIREEIRDEQGVVIGRSSWKREM